MSGSLSTDVFRQSQSEHELASRAKEPIEGEIPIPCKQREGKRRPYHLAFWEFAAAFGQLFFLDSQLFELARLRLHLN